MSRTLRAVDRAGLTAGEAIAWWHTAARGGTAVGFGFSVRTATWWQLADGVPVTWDKPADLTGVYELVGFDGDRELRWRNEVGGRGTAVVLTDVPELLPADGTDVTGRHGVTRSPAILLGEPQSRILAGQVRRIGGAPGWVRLTAARYAPAEIPVTPDPQLDLGAHGVDAPVVVLDSVEYAMEDWHGNVTVVDRRLVRLRIVRHADLRLDLAREG